MPRLPRGTLSREVILDAALSRLATARGGVTMRTLAAELGSDPTAVYRHFRTKDELLGALADRLIADVPRPADAPTWSAYLQALGGALRELLVDYPGAAAVLARAPYTPASVTLLERTLEDLARLGLAGPDAAEACQAVLALVLGHAAAEAADPGGFWAELLDHAPATAFPALAATRQTWRSPPDRQFATALALLLDGVSARQQVRLADAERPGQGEGAAGPAGPRP